MNKGLYGISKNRTYDTKYHILVESASYATTASYISPTFISASAAASGFGSGGTNIDTSSFVTNSQTSSFVLTTQTGSFVKNTETGSFVTNSQTSSFVTNSQTSSFITNSQTSSFVTTSSFNSFTSSYNTGSFTGSFIGTLQGTASFALSASQAISSSYAVSSSFALNALSASYAQTASYSQNLQISGSINNVDYIDFNTGSTVTQPISGRVSWNNTDGTLDVGLKGGNVTLQLGQEQLVRVVNKTATNITLLEANYQAVRLTGAQGQRLKVDLALAIDDANSAETLGLVTETILNNEEGFVTTSGLVRGINTTGALQGETWADGDILYLSPTTAGQVTKIKPIAPDHMVIMGYVVHAHINQGKIYVKVDNGYEIDELHNVNINTGYLASGQLLVRSGSVWINTYNLTGSYTVTGSLTVTGGITGSLQGTAATASFITASNVVGTVVSASNALTASFATNFTITNTLIIDQTLTDFAKVASTIVGSNNLFDQATGSFTSAHGKYTLYKGTNARAGEFVTVWNGTTTTYYDNATTDIGATADIVFQSAIIASDIQINAIAASSGWTVKMIVTYL